MVHYIEINTFSSITILSDSILILDIDDTILKYDLIDKKWWKDNFDKVYLLNNNYDETDEILLNMWKHHIQHEFPSHTDEINLFKLLQENDKTIFLTARDESIKEITFLNFKHLNLEKRIKDIHFCGETSKGKVLKTLLLSPEYQNINTLIVVDDLLQNLIDINDEIKDRKIR